MPEMLKRTVVILSVLILCWSNAFSQNTEIDKVLLRSGEAYFGEVLLRNAELVMMKTQDGTRFQFPLSEIKSIEKVSVADALRYYNSEELNNTVDNGNLCGMLEIAGGVGLAKNKFDAAPLGQISLSFGRRMLAEKTLFIGIGTGIMSFIRPSGSESFGFIPVFARVKNNFTSKSNSPFFLFDAGYSFAVGKEYSGGLYGRLSVGIQRSVSAKTTVFFGAFSSYQAFSAQLTETVASQPFSYYGNAVAMNFGINAGILF